MDIKIVSEPFSSGNSNSFKNLRWNMDENGQYELYRIDDAGNRISTCLTGKMVFIQCTPYIEKELP